MCGYMTGLLYVLLITTAICEKITLQLGDKTVVNFEPTKSGIQFSATSGDTKALQGILGVRRDASGVKCIGQPSCKIGDVNLNVTIQEDSVKILWSSDNKNENYEDSFDFISGVHWFGGPERSTQVWPLEKMKIDGSSAYVIRKLDYFSVAERFWLNSQGAYIFLNDQVPLFVDQNDRVSFIAKIDGTYVNRPRNFLEYTIVLKENAKEGLLHAVKNYLGMPKSHPDERLVRQPIWTTWAKYKADIDDRTVLDYADTIRSQGYKGGQLEIDDNWETCYGSQVIDNTKFANISNTVSQLHKKNFRVSLWVHPFINAGCDIEKEAIAKDYIVKSTNGSTRAEWWNGDNAHQIDFTNKEATEWYSARLRAIQNRTGIDSFKFDAGETDYSAQPSVYPHANFEDVPNTLTSQYVRNDATFGKLIEVRSAWRTQDLPVFLRMRDKDSVWGLDNGLASLITTLFQMNVNGYSFILPDMIGGNGYEVQPDAELIVRWTQANTFMPSMQFSYLPWEFSAPDYNPGQIVRTFVALHEKYANEIIKTMKRTVSTGAPTNPPIWWIDPTDEKALACDDEYMLGDKILVAPVIVKGARSRSVYLPKGEWKDGNSDTIHKGPTALNYSAPIDVLPYFIKQ